MGKSATVFFFRFSFCFRNCTRLDAVALACLRKWLLVSSFPGFATYFISRSGYEPLVASCVYYPSVFCSVKLLFTVNPVSLRFDFLFIGSRVRLARAWWAV